MSHTAPAACVLKPPPAAWLRKVTRPSDRPASNSMVKSATPIASRSSVLRCSMAITTERIASTRAMTGMIHLSLTMRLNTPENFDTCCWDTMVKLRPLLWPETDRSGLKSVTPCESAAAITLLSAGDRLRTIAPPLVNFDCSGVFLPVRMLITASWLCRFSVSQSRPNFGLEKILTARPST